MSLKRFLVLFAAFAVFESVLPPLRAETTQTSPSVSFAATRFPVPPQQITPWMPDKDAPTALVSASMILFAQGLPDPRGCAYRQISIQDGTEWGGGHILKLHGWVLPPTPGDPEQYGLCWDGLVYPLMSVGAVADLDGDIDRLVGDARQRRIKWEKEDQNLVYGWDKLRGLLWESTASEADFDPLKACLLLRFGRADLARKFWAEWRIWISPKGSNRPGPDNTYDTLAEDWEGNLIDRATYAHMRGDDRMALFSAREHARIQPLIEAELARRGVPEREQTRLYETSPSELLADQERRAKESPRVPALTAGLDSFPTKDARIRALILDLDEVHARPYSRPYGVDLGADRIVQALVAQGDDAVEPLLDTFLNDTRLTRSVNFFGRIYESDHTILSVSDTAYQALTDILKSTEFGVDSRALDALDSHQRKVQIAGAVKTYWTKYRTLSEKERWYQILADDHASKEQWVLAANNIVPLDIIELYKDAQIAEGDKSALQRDPLRSKTNPSVSDLLARRALQIAEIDSKDYSYLRADKLSQAENMAMELAEWDPPHAMPTLQTLSRCLYAFTEYPNNLGGNGNETLHRQLGKIVVKRQNMGDPGALSEYADWMERRTMEDFGGSLEEIDEPIWRFPDNPAMSQLAERIFGGDKWGFRKYLELLIMKDGGLNQINDLMISPALGLPAFRQTILKLLLDKRIVAKFARKGGRNSVQIQNLAGNDVSGLFNREDISHVKIRSSTYRVCDVVAGVLSEVAGAPTCKIYWPPRDRDAAVAKCAAFLTQYGDRFRDAPQDRSVWDDSFSPKAHLAFPLMDHPATAADVRDGRAIFALPPGARVVKKPTLPIKATWVTYQGDPWLTEERDPNTNEYHEVTRYDQDGVVWQTEETLVDGRWTRYYGFAGADTIAMVPATEIEFSRTLYGGWDSLGHCLDVDVEMRGTLPADAPLGDSGDPLSGLSSFILGDSLPGAIMFHNRGGLPQTFPLHLIQSSPVRLRNGVTVALRRVSRTDKTRLIDPATWRTELKLTPKPMLTFVPDSETVTLEPNASASIATFDLRDFFDITQPGVYCLDITFARRSGLPRGTITTTPFVIRERSGKHSLLKKSSDRTSSPAP